MNLGDVPKLVSELLRLARRTKQRVEAMVVRGVIAKTDDSKKVQRIQVELLRDEIEDDVEYFQPQGLSFTTEPGAEVVCLTVGADRAHTVAICAQDPSKRPTSTAPGTGGLYTKKNWRVYIDASDVVHIGAKSGAEFIAQAKKTQDQFDKLRTRIDDITTALNQLRTDFTTFGAHTHIVATAMGPATAAPTIPPLVPVPPIAPPLGPATSVAATKGKVT